MTGFTTMPMFDDVFADKDDNNSNTEGCDKTNEKAKVKEKNANGETELPPNPSSGI